MKIELLKEEKEAATEKWREYKDATVITPFGLFHQNPPSINSEYFRIPRSVEVMQYTGFKDRKGTEIYEADILKAFSKSVGPYWIVFENGAFTCYSKYGRWGLLSRAFEIDIRDCVVEVIGNIHEHPELIKL